MTDLISREAAIALIEALPPMFSSRDAIEALTNMPSATIFETRPANLEFFESDQP